MTVTWTSGYNIDEAIPFVEWGWKGQPQVRSPAGTLTFSRGSMCGMAHLMHANLHFFTNLIRQDGLILILSSFQTQSISH